MPFYLYENSFDYTISGTQLFIFILSLSIYLYIIYKNESQFRFNAKI